MPIETYTRNLSIREWAEDDRPREKLMLKGRSALSDAELIAILISTGTKEESAVDLSKRVLQLTQNNLNELGRLGLKDLQKVKGIGEAKAVSIMAALELGRRRRDSDPESRLQITCSRDSFDFLLPYLSDVDHEVFRILLLNRNNRIIHHCSISEGGISGTVVDARIIFKLAIEHLASSIVLSHNHPSGNQRPSEADIQLTRKLKDAGKLLDVNVIDHLILSGNNYFSFADEGYL